VETALPTASLKTGCTRLSPTEHVFTARVNQQPLMHQLVVLSTGWAPFFHFGVLRSAFLFAIDHCTFCFVGVEGLFLVFFPWT